MKRIVLVADPGGHLAVLDWLRPALAEHERLWVTLDTPTSRARLEGERVVFGVGPTARRGDRALRNGVQALGVLRRWRPDAVLSAGAALGVPWLWAARALGVRAAFLEVVDRQDEPSLTGRLVRRFVDPLWVQQPSQRVAYPHADVLGEVLPPIRPARARGQAVFVSFGTHPRPFERLVLACETMASRGQHVVVQHGASRAPRGCESHRWMSHEQLLNALDTARVVVLHGGSSVHAEALAGGRAPLVVGRAAQHGEHVDDHQQGRGTVSPDALADVVDGYVDRGGVPVDMSSEVHRRLAAGLFG